jgi:hypothetical protein
LKYTAMARKPKALPSNAKAFKGLNNVIDPMRLNWEWLSVADNLNITDTEAIVLADGHKRRYTGTRVQGAYSTLDLTRLYLVDNGTLFRVHPNFTAVPLRTGLADRPMHFAEENERVYYANGVDYGIVLPDDTLIDWVIPVPAPCVLDRSTGSLPAGLYRVVCTFVAADGRESGAGDATAIVLDSDAALTISGIEQRAGYTTNVYVASANSTVFNLLTSHAPVALSWNGSPNDVGRELTTQLLSALPIGASLPTFFKARAYLVEFFPSANVSFLYESKPLAPHLYDFSEGFYCIAGEVVLLAGQKEALVVGTRSAIYLYDGEKLDRVADYGTVPGWHAQLTPEKKLIFWTVRGFCQAPPFENLSETKLSAAPGLSAGAAVIDADGYRKYVAVLQQDGGAPYNINRRL